MDPQSDGSGKWRNSEWKRLLEIVLPALDDLPKTLAWTLGGGTGLAISLKHRTSYDIDIFFRDAVALKLLSPNKNKKIRGLSDNWQQPGNYLKIERPEGDIDFLVTHFLTENPSFQYNFREREISVETPAEIIAKKIHYRGSQFTIRDIFDIAAFSISEQEGLSLIASEILDDLPRVLERIKLMRKRYEQTIHDAVFPTETGEKLMDQGADIAVQALEAVIAYSDFNFAER